MRKVYCDDCKWWDTTPSEIGFGCQCRLYHAENSPIRKDDVKRFYSPNVDNKQNDCKGYKPNLIKRILNWINKQR